MGYRTSIVLKLDGDGITEESVIGLREAATTVTNQVADAWEAGYAEVEIVVRSKGRKRDVT